MEEAVRSGDLERVRELIRSGANVNARQWYRSREGSLLHLAIHKGHKDIALALLEAGVDVHAKDITKERTALHWACWGSEEVVQALIDRGGRVNERDMFGNTPLMLADKGNEISLCLLRAGANCDRLEQRRVEELLFLAWKKRDLSAIKTLLSNGCSVSLLSTEEQEELLHHACREGDTFVARILLKNSCSVSILSTEEQEELLYHACREGDTFVARILLKNSCSVSILSTEEQGELLHFACRDGDAFVARILLKNGCSVSILSTEEQEELLHHACHEGDTFVARILLKNSCSVSILSTEEQEELLHLAYCEGDAVVVYALLKDGCSIDTLFRAVNEKVLHHACHENDVFIVRILLKNSCSVSILSKKQQEKLLHHAYCEGDVVVVYALLKDGWSINTQFRAVNEKVLSHACGEGDEFVVEALLANDCNMNCVDATGFTPLIAATERDREQVVKKLILAGANLEMQNSDGNTALHIAASHNSIQCGILLAEGGASVRTKNKLSHTCLDLASVEFRKAIKEGLSFTTRKALCIIGNAESGKSTLIAALQAESNSFIGKIINRFRRVSDRRQRTAGIETVPHCSQRYGEVLFFDFAGQDDYHGPHQMFLESLLSKPGVSMTLLLVVKMTEKEDAILHQLHRWLSPVALMDTPASPPQVIIIGSFLDKVKSHHEEAAAKLTSCVVATRRELSLDIVGSSFLDCRQPQSQGIDQICTFLQDIPIPEFRATHTRYSLAWVLSKIRSSIIAKAVQLSTFSNWVQINKYNLPQTMPPPEEVCQDLSAAGHALYLPNREDPPKSWLVLDLPSILHNVYGTLFSQYRERVNRFGLIQRRHLAELFPHLDLEMVQQLLISLEFCLPVDPSVLKVDLSELTQCEENGGWLFFPALISAKPPQSTLKDHPQQSVPYLCWQLRTAKKDSISARLLQNILLRLAAHFVVKQPNEEGVQQHCCSIWWNGILWQSTKGIDITIHIVNNRVVEVLSASITSPDKSCQYLTDVISDILSTVHRLSPKLAAGAYIVHPPKTVTSPMDITAPPPQDLFPVEGIRKSFRDGYSLSLKDSNSDRSTRAAIFDLFGGYIPSLENIGRINWPQPDPSQPQSPCGPSQPDALSHTACTCEGYPILFRTYVSRPSAGKGRAVLERIGLAPETIRACYGRHPLEEEEAVQDGLIKWAEGHHGYNPTWRVLLNAMEYAGVAQHHCQGLREELYQRLIEVPATPSQPHPAAEQSKADLDRGAASGSPIPSGDQELHVSPNQPQSPTGPNQSPTGPNQSPAGPNQSPAGPNQSPAGPNQPELHSEVNTVLTPTDSNTTPSGAHALLDVSSTPDVRDVDELVVIEVAADWERVALRLGVEGCAIRVIFRNNPNDCEGACRDMFNRWLRRERHTGEEERTWSSLLTALGRAGFEELERTLRREHFLSP